MNATHRERRRALTLDLGLQDLLERQMAQYLSSREKRTASRTPARYSSIIKTMEIRAAIGSANFRAGGYSRPGGWTAGVALAGLGVEAVYLCARAG